MDITRCVAVALWCLAAANAEAAPAATYPNRPLTLVVPFPAGGSMDAIARAIGIPLGKNLGHPVVVENVGGGSGSIGAGRVARSKADGYTLLLGSMNEVVLAPLVNQAVTYKTEDLVPVGKVGETQFILVGRKGISAHSIDELIEYAREHPGGLTYATSGIGSQQHAIMDDIQKKSGTSMLHVPYRGGSSVVTDLLGGQVDLALVAPATFRQLIESGRVQVFGTTGLKRDPLLKDFPTLNEGKYLKGVNQVAWLGIFVPANTPPEIDQKLSSAIKVLLSDPEVVTQLKRSYISPSTPADQPAFPGSITNTRAQMRAFVSKLKLDKN